MSSDVREFVYYNDGHVYLKKNNRRIGSRHCRGYLETSINGQRWLVHRLVWFLVNGNEPAMIDHIDGDKLNNSIDNLRVCTPTQSSGNTRPRKNSKTGVKGVHMTG